MQANNSEENPKVLFSYSWDSTDHKFWVRKLAERLVLNGVNVMLDEWHVQPGESLTKFMEENIQLSDYTIIICTPNYAKKSIERKGGVGYEQQIISGNIASGVSRKKFIPVVRVGSFEVGPSCAIPPHFLGVRAIDMRDDTNHDLAFEILLRAVWSEPELVPPALGKKPTFGSLASRELLGPIRLPTSHLDGYYLKSGVASSQQFPDTFEIPEEVDRHSVRVGDLVKLYFGITPSGDPKDVEFERMWVKVSGSNGAYLTGTLENEPACADKRNRLHWGDKIIFLPEHILNIMTIEDLEFYEEAKKYDEEVAGLLWMHGIVKEDRESFLQALKDGSFRAGLEEDAKREVDDMGGTQNPSRIKSLGDLLSKIRNWIAK